MICLGDADVGVLVPDEVDVGGRQVFADDHPPGAADLVVPLADAVVEEGHASLVAEAVVADGTVGLTGGPVVELRIKKTIGTSLDILVTLDMLDILDMLDLLDMLNTLNKFVKFDF